MSASLCTFLEHFFFSLHAQQNAGHAVKVVRGGLKAGVLLTSVWHSDVGKT